MDQLIINKPSRTFSLSWFLAEIELLGMIEWLDPDKSKPF
jgi:hypothetical protein